MNTERAQVGWGFWLWWVLANTVGFAVGFSVGFTVGMAVGEALSEGVGFSVPGAVVVAVAGASVGIVQWLVLRQQVSRAGWWVLASIVSFVVGETVGEVVGETVVFALGFTWYEAVAFAEAVIFAVVGASVGIAQWLVLRQQVSRAGWWVLASIVGFVVSIAMGRAVGFTLYEAVAFAEAVVFAVVGAGYGAITGGVMVWLLRQPAAGKLGPRQAAE
jgi:hypothetical protein